MACDDNEVIQRLCADTCRRWKREEEALEEDGVPESMLTHSDAEEGEGDMVTPTVVRIDSHTGPPCSAFIPEGVTCLNGTVFHELEQKCVEAPPNVNAENFCCYKEMEDWGCYNRNIHRDSELQAICGRTCEAYAPASLVPPWMVCV